MSSNSWKHKILLIKCNEQAHSNCTKFLVLFWLHLDFTSDDWLALYLKCHNVRSQRCEFSFLPLVDCNKPLFQLNINQKKFTLKIYHLTKANGFTMKKQGFFSCTNKYGHCMARFYCKDLNMIRAKSINFFNVCSKCNAFVV